MSALRKQSSLRWTFTNEFTRSGAILCTNWETHYGKFRLLVTNFPGTKTLAWEINTLEGDPIRGGSEDRFEFTVSTLKDKVLEKAKSL